MRYLPQEIIRKKRDNEPLSEDEIAFMMQGLAEDTIGDEQIAAFCMAIYFNGMHIRETVALTTAMRDSGASISWGDVSLNGPLLDKHSTGGVGDKVSLMLAPVIAACGAHVPMISGRGLGHTGGTLDKLGSIPGYDPTPDIPRFKKIVSEVGAAIIGQTPDLAPADKRCYAVRDVTATVESIPLITASILSKKLAAGLDALVMDVKTGNGAFVPKREMSDSLAANIVSVAQGAGLSTSALITDMNQTLGHTVGNALEVRETLAYLSGERREPRLHEVVLALASEMLVLGGIAETLDAGRARIEQALDSGAALEVFEKMTAALGGPSDLVANADKHLAQAPFVKECFSDQPGFVTQMNARAIGVAAVSLGGGRARISDVIDPSVGLSDCCHIGDMVDAERPVAVIHAKNEEAAEGASVAIKAAITVSDQAPDPELLDPVLHGRITGA